MRLGKKRKRGKEGRLLIARFLKSRGQSNRTTKLPTHHFSENNGIQKYAQ
jgi:hypothetical protein